MLGMATIKDEVMKRIVFVLALLVSFVLVNATDSVGAQELECSVVAPGAEAGLTSWTSNGSFDLVIVETESGVFEFVDVVPGQVVGAPDGSTILVMSKCVGGVVVPTPTPPPPEEPTPSPPPPTPPEEVTPTPVPTPTPTPETPPTPTPPTPPPPPTPPTPPPEIPATGWGSWYVLVGGITLIAAGWMLLLFSLREEQ